MTSGDKMRAATISVSNEMGNEQLSYDSEGRLSQVRQTFAGRGGYPMLTDYLWDSLDRLKESAYPQQYGAGEIRKKVETAYDIASRLDSLKFGGVTYASNPVYNAASQTTSLNIGSQTVENYAYDPKTGLLTNQKVNRGTESLVDLKYNYTLNNDANNNGAKSGQLTGITDLKNQARNRAYEYSKLGQLIKVKGGVDAFNNSAWFQSYSYDQYGNRNMIDHTGEAVWVDDGVPAGAAQSAGYPGPSISLRSWHGYYVAAEGGGGSDVYANRTAIGSWEQFTLVDLNGGALESGDSVQFLAADRIHYVGAMDGGAPPPGGRVYAGAPWGLTWETFTIRRADGASGPIGNDTQISLQSYRGYYVAAEFGSGEMNANRSSVGPWEIFTLVMNGSTSIDESWTWVGGNPYSGAAYHQSNIASGIHQHYFYGATQTLQVNAGDKLYTYVYLDPANMPSTVMLQWNDGNWEHRAYWGANNIVWWGVDGTESRRHMGPLPAGGGWVKLEVPASAVGLEGKTLNGMAFTLYGGRAWWDKTGKSSGVGSSNPLAGSANLTNNRINSSGDMALAKPASQSSASLGVKAGPAVGGAAVVTSSAGGPVVALGFNEGSGSTTADASGNNNTGTLLGGVSWTTAGKYGQALSFDGGSGVVRIPDSPTWKVDGLTGYTMSMWVKVKDVSGDYRVALGKGEWPSGDIIINKYENTWSYGIRTTDWYCGGSTTALPYLTTADNTYHHIAVSMDASAGQCHFYSERQIAGSDEYVSGTTVFATGAGLNNLYIGGLDGTHYINADIDEVRIYTTGLTQAEIQTDMNTPIGGAPSGDTTPPVISGVTAGSIGATTATITWTTNENSDSQVEYGPTTAYGQSTTLNTSLLTAHAEGLSGLTAGTLYHYRVKSKDAAGNLAVSGDFSFTTATAGDVTPPVITGVSSSAVTNDTATITWTTNEPADSQVEYGLTTAYGQSTTLNTSLVTAHSQGLSGLSAGTLYHYRVKSKDAAGNLAVSADFTFTIAQSGSIPLDGLANISYDPTNNRINTLAFLYHPDGSQIQAVIDASGTQQQYRYDCAGRLVQVLDANGTSLATYAYGAGNQRLMSAEGVVTKYFAWDGGQIIAEYEASGTNALVWKTSYVYMGGRLLATTSGAGGTETQFHHPDRLGTRLVTDAAGTVVTEQFTLPFGNTQPFTSVYGGENPYQSPTLSNPSKKRFTSYDRSDATKLDYAVNRFYSPQQGRFTQVDPIEMDATSLGNRQSLNLYSYCGNDPINHVDPDGLFFGNIFGAIRKFFSSTIGKIVAVVALTVLSLGLLGPLTFQPILGAMSLGETVATVVGATQLTALGWATVGLAVLSGVSLPGGFGGYGGFRTPNTFPNSTGVGAISAFAKTKIPPPPRAEINYAIRIARIIAKENGIILTKANLAKLRKIFILNYNDGYLDLDERRYPQQGATKSVTQSGANTSTTTVTLGEKPTVAGAEAKMGGGSITDSISISDADMARGSEIHAVTGSFVDEYTRRLENIGFRRDYAASRARFISRSVGSHGRKIGGDVFQAGDVFK